MSGRAPLRSTVADIDLDAIAANFSTLRAHGKGEVIAVIKADAYGHGVEGVAPALVEAGAAMLAVATVEEALVLRAARIEAPILVLLGASDRDEADAAVAARCTLVVWDVENAHLIAAAAAMARTRAAVHFKVDTGLTRLGAPLDDAVARYRAVRDIAQLSIDGVFTHFATADDPDLGVARDQVRRFVEVLAHIGEPPRLVHAAASAGVASLGAIPGCTAIRPGVSLFGFFPAPHQASTYPLRPALSWRSRVRRVVSAKKGTGVSYGHEYRLPRDGRIATVPVGYGDGLPRAFGRKGHLLIGGRALPFAGRVCMDLVMLDVTDMDVHEGDEVAIIGAQGGAAQSADDLASVLGTINYEITTAVRRRVPRRFLRGGRVVATRTLADGYMKV